MFAMPMESKQVDQASLMEEASDAYPIQLQALVTVEKFNDLLLWFYKGYWGYTKQPMFELQTLRHILEIIMFFMMDDGKNWAIAEIEGCGLTAVQTLLMGQKYHISGWVSKAVHQAHLTLSDYHNLSIHKVFVLDQAHTQIQDHQLAVAFNPPKVVHNYMVYTHISPQEAMAKLDSVLILNMTTEYYLKTIEFIATKGVIVKEDAYVAATIVALM
ncbi:hypothetical protein JB92DRAFT_2830066 [Gautieria morchelliformis]|nr:hypothetical protein JB92DRAFT_2830066 [Gautieria morchelliformis]